ncbi:MAG: AraC family transcriptional regulator [Anaerocolumna sp.]|jgi:AraC-like DNA-binding protein|nr:AraC family transcriptional regulator [Anaerocolumna sp.]
MPQVDRYKDRTINIEFISVEEFNHLPYPERYTLIFITNGCINGVLNDRPIKIMAPGALCLSHEDTFWIVDKQDVSAQTFCFHSDFLSSVAIYETEDYISPDLRIQTGLALFNRDNIHTGVEKIPERAYLQLLEWFFVLGTEVYAQSNDRWICRIKKYLIQILGLLEELNNQNDRTPVDLVLEYIHTNYSNKITLEDITQCAHINRVSLNKMFQDRCGYTAVGYLLTYRLKVACDLLTHTAMTLSEIARATGFEYDTYFIKQFTSKKGVSPTTYRISSRKISALL